MSGGCPYLVRGLRLQRREVGLYLAGDRLANMLRNSADNLVGNIGV
jgi:hypothetical protein